MRRVIFPVMIVSLAMAPVALEAQTPRAERGGFGAGFGAMGARGVQAVNPAARVLAHRDALSLSLDQVRQLQQLQAQIDSRNQPLLAQIQAIRPAARSAARDEMRQRAADMTPGQREQMRERMQGQRGAMQAQRERMQGRHEQMTPEQREQMRAQMQEQRQRMQQATPEQREQMRAEMRERMPAGRGAGGVRQGREVSPELRAQLEALRPVMQQLQESNRQARTDVQAVLTAEQQATLRELQAQRGAEMRQRFQRDGDRPARPAGQNRRGANR